MAGTIRISNFLSDVYEVTLALSAVTYASGDVLSTSVEIPLRSYLTPDTTYLRGQIVSCRVLDEDDQGVAMDIVFMRSNVSLGSVDSAVSISDANAREIVAIVNAVSYVDLINSQQSSPEFLPKPFKLGSGVKSLYVSAITRGAPTHTASGLRLQVGIVLENQTADLGT